MESFQRLAHLLRGRVFPVDKRKRYMNYQGASNKGITIWYEEEQTKLQIASYSKELIDLFGGFLLMENKPLKFLFILDDWNQDDNWYYKKDKTFVVTAKGALNTLYSTYLKKGNTERAQSIKEEMQLIGIHIEGVSL